MSISPKSGILRRAAANAGLLLSGKAAAGLMQLATFAIAARGLGITDFGYFSILTAQVMLITGIAAFDSNQAIIRYGVDHLGSGNRAAYQALIKAGTLLDFGAAALAALAAFVLAPIIGARLGWDPRIVMLAQLIAPLSFANAISTAKGMLRLFDRFDLLGIHSVVTPAIRLVGFAGAWATGSGLMTYLLVWLAAGWAGAVAGFSFAWREAHRRDLLIGIDRSLSGLSRENKGVWRFTLYSNLNSSVALIPTQLATFLVGAMVGPAAAGLFRVARELGTGLMKPADLVSQALYPDLARLVATGDWSRARRTALRAGLIAGGAGVVVALIVWIIAPHLLGLVFGSEFRAAAPILALLAAGTTLRVFAFPADPMMYALNHPSAPLRVALVANLVFLALLLWRLPRDGVIGAGWSYIVMCAIAAILSTVWAGRTIARREAISRNPEAAPDRA